MTPRERIAAARAAGLSTLLEPDAKAVLQAFGIAVPRSLLIGDDSDIDAAASLRAPYALKVVSPAIVHKSDVGGVHVGCADIAALRRALADMCRVDAIRHDRARIGFLVEEMAPRGHEIVIGATLHPQFGPVIMVGLGGIFVEVLDDVAFRLCPIDRVDACEMLDELRGIAVLRGARGSVAANQALITETLIKVGGQRGLLMELRDEIREIDINPLIVDATQASAVDARIVLAPPAT